MARVTKLPNGDIIFNVDHSVGTHGRNHKTDVQLVQFLLNRHFEFMAETAQMLDDAGFKPPEKLAVDGVCGPKTKAAILWFQKRTGQVQDGTMNRVDDDGVFGKPGDRRIYALWFLNNALDRNRLLPSKSDISVQPLAAELSKFTDKPKVRPR